MKFILVAAALNLQVTYPSDEVCQKALDRVLKNDPAAFCIPAGEDQTDQVFNRFFNLIKKIESTNITK